MRKQEIEDSPERAASRQDMLSADEPADETGLLDGSWRRWCWLRHWEFWLALALGAFLRLWQIGTTQFLDDQTGLYVLARLSVLHGAIPLTGIPSSIGTLNPPLSVYLLLPFAAITANPLPAVVTLALWNVAGVALCYIFAARYFGRVVAAVGTLLFATNAAALNYSRFLWQQNYLPPLLVLWALTLYMGAVRGKRRWLAGNILLLCLAILLHATAALLAPVTLVGILLAPRLPRLRAYLVAAAGVLVLLAPTLLFEVTSRGYDLRKLAHYALHGGQFNGQIFTTFLGALSGAGSGDLGPQAPYAASAAWFPIVPWMTVALVVAGWIVLTVRVIAPAVALWRGAEPDFEAAGLLARGKRWVLALWHGPRTDAVWRGRFLLWFWVTLPPLTMLRHSGALYVHYLLVIFPAVFLVGGFGVEWVMRRSATLPARTTLLRHAAPALALILVALVVIGQGVRYFLYPASIASGSFSAYVSYGYPLGELLTLNDQLDALQQRQGARTVYIVTPDASRYRQPEQYLLAADRADRVAFEGSCLVLPAANDGAALAVSLAPGSPAETLLSSLPNAQAVTRIPLAGGAPLTVYRIAGATPALGDEITVTNVVYRNGAAGLRLDAVSPATAGLLRLRWTILSGPPAGSGTPIYSIAVRLPGAGAASTAQTECAATRLHAGQTLFTWVNVPPQSTPPLATIASGARIQVSAGTQSLDEFTVGPLRFLADDTGSAPLQPWRQVINP